MSDQNLQRRVIAALASTPEVDVARIGVAVRNGVVTLSGHVHQPSEKAAAERTVLQVAGVRAIAEHLEIRPPEATRTADDEIADRAVRLLAWDLNLPEDAIRVIVEHGVVQLAGTVDTEYERRHADRDVRQLHGVREVVNRIRLRTRHDFSCAGQDRAIQAHACGNGTVVLEGHVLNEREREEAEAALAGAPGVLRVDNRLVIQAH